MGLIYLLQPFLQHVRVNLGRGDITVTQHELNRSQIRAALQKVRGKRMPDQMRSKPGRQSGTSPISRQNLPKTDARKRSAPPVQEKPGGLRFPAKSGTSGTKVGLHGAQTRICPRESAVPCYPSPGSG